MKASGARHAVCSRDGRHAYVVNELDSTVSAFAFDEGRLTPVQRASALPDSFFGFSRAAGIVLEMPFLGDDVGEEPVQLVCVGDQLGEQAAQVPLEQHATDIEDDSRDLGGPDLGGLCHAPCSDSRASPTEAARSPVRRRAVNFQGRLQAAGPAIGLISPGAP